MNIGPVYDNLDGFSKLWEHIKSFYGGYYPIGANNYWHTGLHVQGAEPVKAIAPGKIIAYRITHDELDYIKIFEMHNGDKYPAISRFDYGMAKDYRFNPRNDINLKEILDRYYDTGGTNDPIPFKKNTAIQDERHGRLIKQFLYCTSNNFVLVEHTIPFMKESEGAIKYYSLYMHLKAISSLTQTQRESITKSFAYTMEMSNNLDKQAVRNLEEPLPADRDSVLGFPGYIRHQSNICHIEIFSSDKRILELWKHADPAKVAIYGLGEYQVSGPVTCMPVYNFTNTRTQDIQPLTLNKDDKIQYYDVSTDYKGVIDCVRFKKESENDENIYRVKTGDIKREGYRIEGGRISADNQNGKIVYRDPLFWHNFSCFQDPDDFLGLNKRNNKCDIPAIIAKLQSGRTADNNVDRSEITNAVNSNRNLYTELSRMIVYSNSEWDGKRLEGFLNSAYRFFSDDVRMKHKECQAPLQITNMVTPLKEIEFFYFFHPGMFIENLSKLFASDGWKLTKSGALIQGKTGWLIDENGYYILQDGRRLPENAMSDNDKGLRIGHEQPKTGLYEIMKCNPEIELKINAEYNVYDELLNLYGGKMQNDVVYQAFQINTGYTLQDNEWKSCGIGSWNHAVFTSIGKDETGIPIIVTGIGEDGFNKKKLVIAGPHGDERNAQRLILTTQRHFTQNGRIPDDLALYFIPSISPTMAFADARGIPNQFWANTVIDHHINELYDVADREKNAEKIYAPILINGKFMLNPGLTIPELHNSLATRIPVAKEIENTKKYEKSYKLMRTAIQTYNTPGYYPADKPANERGSPLYPKYGIDANRDYYYSLPSSQMFVSFIKNIIKETNTSAKTATTTELTKKQQKTIDNIRVLMMHGYDGSGAVYGPYDVLEKTGNSPWPAAMSRKDLDRIDDIMKKIEMLPWGTRDGTPLYADTANNAKPYQGEWSRHLYAELEIWSVDIELAGLNRFKVISYDEGRRGDNYNSDMVGKTTLPYFDKIKENSNGFYSLLKDFSW